MLTLYVSNGFLMTFHKGIETPYDRTLSRTVLSVQKYILTIGRKVKWPLEEFEVLKSYLL